MDVVFLTCCIVYLKEKWACFTLLTQHDGKYYLLELEMGPPF